LEIPYLPQLLNPFEHFEPLKPLILSTKSTI